MINSLLGHQVVQKTQLHLLTMVGRYQSSAKKKQVKYMKSWADFPFLGHLVTPQDVN